MAVTVRERNLARPQTTRDNPGTARGNRSGRTAGPGARAARANAPAAQAPAVVLPVPPHDSEKYAYVRRHSWVLTLCSAICFPCLAFSQVELIGRYPWFWAYAPFALLGMGLFMLPLLTDGLSRGFDVGEHRRIVAGWQPERYPSVDIFLPVCGEPIQVLRNTWMYVAQLSQSYHGQVTTYVLDDAASPELKQMAWTGCWREPWRLTSATACKT